MNRQAFYRTSLRPPAALLLLAALAGASRAEPSLLDAIPARALGPGATGGRIVDLAVVESNPDVMYVAAATGGLWKTIDGGKSWEAVFDRQDTLSLGCVSVAPSNPDVVWVGTGEANARNSVSWGDGVYKSIDGGKTWKNMGLADSRHVGRIVIHPTNPDIVFVAALGRLWGPNKERGLYRTADGGKTWQQVKFLDEDAGFIDLAIDPSNPDILYAAACCVRRDGFAGANPAVQTGPNAGLYRSTDGGATWERLTAGLPDRPLGRCGLAVYRKDPRVVYAVVQTDKTDASIQGQPPKLHPKTDDGGVFRSEDRGKTWIKVNDLCPRPFYFGQVRVDPTDARRVYVLGVELYVSDDGGQSFPPRLVPQGLHDDHHALWIDPKDPTHVILGGDGGLFVSTDRAKTWAPIHKMPLGQFYGVAADMRKPYWVYGGLQDAGSWGGPSATDRIDGVGPPDWRMLAGGDGFRAQADPTDPTVVYVEEQYGRATRLNPATKAGVHFRPESPVGEPAYRFNWDTPLLLSPHDHNTLYMGANFLLRSDGRGDRWEPISPDLTRGKPGPSADGLHTITAVAESPLKAGVLWAGTDDGRLGVSRDGGKTWKDVSDKIPDVPADRWIDCVECSAHAEGTAFVAIDRHRNDDVRPYVFKTADFGETWTPVAGDLPEGGPVHVVRQSSRNADLLFAGTEFGLFATSDGGKHWRRLTNGVPPGVCVRDLLIHPRDRDLVVGTHGRGIFILDIAPLEEATPEALAAHLHVFDVKPARAFAQRDAERAAGYWAPNPPYGAVIRYYLRDATEQAATVAIKDAAGKTVATLAGPKNAGLNTVAWDLRPAAGTALAAPGDYTATVTAGGASATKPVRVEPAE